MRYPHTATVKRLVSSQGKQLFTSVGNPIACWLQPLDVEAANVVGMSFGKSYVCYFPLGSDVQEKDRIIIDGNKYGVRGIANRNYGGLKHMKAMVEEAA